MASVSSTSSLGNTSLRGFGGMASGIDRDAIIEKMTLGTTTKISNRKKEVTKLQWKQEAYRNLSDKIIDISDKYASYTSTSNLKDPFTFAKNIITAMGREEATRFVKATGSSRLIDNISIKEVSQLATSTVLQSQKHINDNGIQTSLNGLTGTITPTSMLNGTKLIFGVQDGDGRWTNTKTFEFKDTYTVEEDGKEVTKKISYVPKMITDSTGQERLETDEEFAERLTGELNEALKNSDIVIGEDKDSPGSGVKIGEAIKFQYDKANGTIGIVSGGKGLPGNYTINGASTALKALGYEKSGSVSVADLGPVSVDKFADSALRRPETIDYLTNKKLTFDYNGTRKEIALLTKDEADYLKNIEENYKFEKNPDGTNSTVETGYVDADGKLTESGKKKQLEDLATLIQGRLDRAFGENAVEAGVTDKGLSFKTGSSSGESSSVSILSNDTELLQNLGIAYGESNKVNTGGKLNQSALGIDASKYTLADSDELDLVINGERIHGLTKDSTIDDILSKINSTPGAGVKATYVDATGQFMLVASETGAGRNIELDSELANELFGVGTGDKAGQIVQGENAKIKVSYGNGVDVDLERSSNIFNLEGLNVTVSGIFGGDWNEINQADYDPNNKNHKEITNADGSKTYMKWTADSSETVTFSAKADVDGVVEKVKGFFEDFNALVADINGQVRTRPDSSFGPLTDEQKDEMDETSIENWEKKAKQGMLYGDSAMRDLSVAVQSIFSKMMSNGASYEDLKEIGITYSEDYGDGGTLVFDETAFRTAMENNPEKVSRIFTGGNGISKGLVNVVEETFTPYATRYANRNGGSYGRLVEIAGTNKKPTTLMDNDIYKQLKEMQETIDSLNERLQVEQDRYISQFTTMETLLNKMNTQSSYLSQLTA